MKIGTYYYPEQWPRHQWERDFDNIVKMGLQIVHMGEFAWFEMEPSPGDIRLDWLADAVEMARARDLDVILCTPTAAPPVWLIDQFPDVLPVNEYGQRGRFGGRRHYTPVSPSLREATVRIVTALAERFAGDPSVIGWQIDNEYSGSFDQSEHAHAAFRDWLRRKYGSIDNLNKAWGCQFWNTYYTDWSQILFPAKRDLNYDNPHHRLDASRFWSWAYADFNKLQADILKRQLSVVSGQLSLAGGGSLQQRTTDNGRRTPFITTNFMPLHPDVNPADMADDLSLMAWDSYPVTGWDKNPTNEEFRMADPSALGFVHDHMASFNGRWALLEVQVGQTNWSNVPVLLYPGVVRLWLWTALAHGAEMITVYRFRQPLWGTEMFHHGLVETDGLTPSPGGQQFAQVIEDVKRLDLAKIPPLSEDQMNDDPQATAGILLDFDQLWYYLTMPQAKRWSQPQWLYRWYGALTRLGLGVRILHPDRPWPTDLKLLVVPGLQMVDDAVVGRLNEFAGGGGHLVLTCRTALMDKTGQFREGPTAQPILPLIGARIEGYDGLPKETFGQVEMDGKRYPWGAWGDLLKPDAGTDVIARYADQFYARTPAVTRRRHAGGGLVTYCGVYGEAGLIEAVTETAAAGAGLRTVTLARRTQLLRRGPYRIFLNYQDQPTTAPAPLTARFRVGRPEVEPAGVAIWEE